MFVGAGMTARKPIIPLSLMYAIKHTMRLHKVNCNGWFSSGGHARPYNKIESFSAYKNVCFLFAISYLTAR